MYMRIYIYTRMYIHVYIYTHMNDTRPCTIYTIVFWIHGCSPWIAGCPWPPERAGRACNPRQWFHGHWLCCWGHHSRALGWLMLLAIDFSRDYGSIPMVFSEGRIETEIHFELEGDHPASVNDWIFPPGEGREYGWTCLELNCTVAVHWKGEDTCDMRVNRLICKDCLLVKTCFFSLYFRCIWVRKLINL